MNDLRAAKGTFPDVRMRRLRRAEWTRRLVAETTLNPADLILPIFVVDGESQPIKTMPNVSRLSIADAVETARRAHAEGIPMIAPFPSLDPALRDQNGSLAHNPDNLVCRTVKAIKDAVPDIGVMCDVALDPYTSHGHDGIWNDAINDVDNDATLEALRRQALVLVAAGCDVIAPSDMMDGRVGVLRKTLEDGGYQQTLILAYSVKYASAFYGPFRDAIGSTKALKGDKKGYQMNPANADEALREAQLDIAEGADILMVKPAMPYLDVLRRLRDQLNVPVAAYQVSGEYAAIQFAAKAQALKLNDAMMESLLCLKRGGANAILTYFALDAARNLSK